MNGETEAHEQGLVTRDKSHSKTDTGGQPTGMSCSIHKSEIIGPGLSHIPEWLLPSCTRDFKPPFPYLSKR